MEKCKATHDSFIKPWNGDLLLYSTRYDGKVIKFSGKTFSLIFECWKFSKKFETKERKVDIYANSGCGCT